LRCHPGSAKNLARCLVPRFEALNDLPGEEWNISPAPRSRYRQAYRGRRETGGIIIPDTAKEKPQQGEIIAVGPGGRDETGKLIPMDVKAGDRVLFGKMR
jgi:hypothetical protein